MIPTALEPALEPADSGLTPAEKAKRNGLRSRKPYVAAKLANIAAMEDRGEISPIIRLEKSYLCNFQCTHCCAEYYMDRHKKKQKIEDTRRQVDLADVRELSRQADELGLARFVITGGEPLVMKDFDAVVEAIDPEKHYVITDTNGWLLDLERARHLKAIGVEKVQLSLDSYDEADHDAFRNKPGSYKRVMRAIDASLDAGLNLILSTVLVKGRARTEEFRDLCRFATERCVGLYVCYAKPTGACSDHPELVIDKEDADVVRELEKQYNVFTHMTPSYGSFKGCIAMKGIVTVTSTFEVTPCPYIDLSLGNLRETPLKEILARGMRNPWLGPYRPDCVIGEDEQFIRFHADKTEGITHLPVPWGEGFSEGNSLFDGRSAARADVAIPGTPGFFDPGGRAIPGSVKAPVHQRSRGHFLCRQPAVDFGDIHRRTLASLGVEDGIPLSEFVARAERILESLRSDPGTANVLKGVHVPFLLPPAGEADPGEALEAWLEGVRRAFAETFPERTFTNHHKGGLAGKLAVAPGSRHDRLLGAAREGWAVGYYFPCLGEYSVPAAVEQVQRLPESFLLAGGIDTAAALVGSPDLLLRTDGYPPILWLAGLQGEKEGVGYHFEAYGYNLTFNRRMHLGQAAESAASGLTVIG